MKVAICRSAKAYLPEADAYRRYLTDHGIAARCVDKRSDIEPGELAILFRFEDQFSRDLHARRRVHEEHNIPVGLRGAIRSVSLRAGGRPDGEIRLEQADDALPDRDCPKLVRPCGVDEAIFAVTPNANPDFDLAYCGSLDRPGVPAEIERLARLGFRIAVYGRIPPGTPQSRMEAAGVQFFGRISRHEVPEALANTRAGLNVTPDRPPWNRQESIKTLEYLAAGLPVVSNRYRWAAQFADARQTAFLWLDDVEDPASLERHHPARVNLSDRVWATLLDRVGFIDFLREIDG